MLPIKRVLDGIERAQSLLTNVFFVLTIVVVTFQVVNRFWFQLPVVWTADFAVMCFIWLGFLSASVAVRRSGHFRVTMLLELKRFEGTGRRVLELVGLAVIVLVSAILLFEGTRITISGLRETAPGLQVSMAWGYIAVPLCSLSAILFALEKMWDQFVGAAPSEHAIDESDAA
jgi:TRAP-type C4-dicarboxylate transport system permease small subunit